MDSIISAHGELPRPPQRAPSRSRLPEVHSTGCRKGGCHIAAIDTGNRPVASTGDHGTMNRAQLLLARFDGSEYRLCRGLNRATAWPGFLKLMRVASRLGDWPLWAGLLIALPVLYGSPALRVVLIMAATGLSGHLIYRRVKPRWCASDRLYAIRASIWPCLRSTGTVFPRVTPCTR